MGRNFFSFFLAVADTGTKVIWYIRCQEEQGSEHASYLRDYRLILNLILISLRSNLFDAD